MLDPSIQQLSRRVNRLDDTVRHERFKVPFAKLDPSKTTVYKVTWETTKDDKSNPCQRWRYKYHTARNIEWLYIKDGDEELPLYYATDVPAYIIHKQGDKNTILTTLPLYMHGPDEAIEYDPQKITSRKNIDVLHEWPSEYAAIIDSLKNINRKLPAATYQWTVQMENGTTGYVHIKGKTEVKTMDDHIPLITTWYPTEDSEDGPTAAPNLDDINYCICDENGTIIDPQPSTKSSLKLTAIPYGVPLKVPCVITCKAESLSVYMTDQLNLRDIVDATTDGFIYTNVYSSPGIRTFSQAPLALSLTTGPSFVDIDDKRSHLKHGQGIVFGTYNQYPFGWINYGGTLFNINQHTVNTTTEFGPGFQYVILYDGKQLITDDINKRIRRMFYILEKDVNNHPRICTSREPFLILTPFHDTPCDICKLHHV